MRPLCVIMDLVSPVVFTLSLSTTPATMDTHLLQCQAGFNPFIPRAPYLIGSSHHQRFLKKATCLIPILGGTYNFDYHTFYFYHVNTFCLTIFCSFQSPRRLLMLLQPRQYCCLLFDKLQSCVSLLNLIITISLIGFETIL